MRIQFWHLVVLLLVILLLFGANRLPDLARSVGRSMKIFKSEVKELRDEPADETPPTPSAGQSGPRTPDAADPTRSGSAGDDPGAADR